MLQLKETLREEYNNYSIRPQPLEIFRAFQVTPFEKVRVVIIGQDPYPHGNHSDGMAFSSKLPETPASLRYILREVDRDIVKTKTYKEYKEAFPTNSLLFWAEQGVLLLNTVLTVKSGLPGSHNGIGWQEFTFKVLSLLNEDPNPKVFVGWGAEAAKVLQGIDKHLVLLSGHPATASHGRDQFSGCNHFSKINHYFYKNNLPEINWKLI